MNRKLVNFICPSLVLILVSCGNNGTGEPHQDSTGQSSSLPPETNYVMENNVTEPIKQPAVDTMSQTMVSPVDTTVTYLVDSVSVKK